MPSILGWSVANVATGSMEPNIPTGSLILVKESGTYAPGDIVVYHHNNEMTIVHRIVAINESTAITKGDSNNIADPPIAVSSILGKVQHVIPSAGKVIQQIKKPEILVSMLALIVISMVLPLPVKEKKEGRSV